MQVEEASLPVTSSLPAPLPVPVPGSAGAGELLRSGCLRRFREERERTGEMWWRPGQKWSNRRTLEIDPSIADSNQSLQPGTLASELVCRRWSLGARGWIAISDVGRGCPRGVPGDGCKFLSSWSFMFVSSWSFMGLASVLIRLFDVLFRCWYNL